MVHVQKVPRRSTHLRRSVSNDPLNAPSSWLLRLFQSEFFDARLAVLYLHKYPNSVGVQHYITRELRCYDEEELEFLLPQILHMLISRPESAGAIESFVINLCRDSPHMAILTMWYLESYLNEMERSGTLASSYRLVQRVYASCQTIVFSDADTTTKSPISTTSSGSPAVSRRPYMPFLPHAKLAFNVPATLMGIGLPFISISSPRLSSASRPMIFSESLFATSNFEDNELEESDESRRQFQALQIADPDTAIDDQSLSVEQLPRSSAVASVLSSIPQVASISPQVLARLPTSSPSLEELSKGSAFSFSNFVKKASSQTAAFLNQVANQSGQVVRSASSGVSGHRHTQSNGSSSQLKSFVDGTRPPLPPNVSSSIFRKKSASSDTANPYPNLPNAHLQLQNSHYYHAEMTFIMTLIDISDRLRSVPKTARQSTLVAELNLLNHNLPANVCIPLWCPATATNPKHHRVVRICPSDCVVLNSADRVPYLIMIEVVEPADDDTKGSGATSVRRKSTHSPHRRPSVILDGESVTGSIPDGEPLKRQSFDSNGNRDHSKNELTPGDKSPNLSSAEYHKSVMDRRQSMSNIAKTPLSIQTSPNAFGKSIPLPPKSSGGLSNKSENDRQLMAAPTNPAMLSVTTSTHKLTVSNDEFSELMRTAAVMLAQLYQQQQRELVNSSSPTMMRKQKSAEWTPSSPITGRATPTMTNTSAGKAKAAGFEEIRNRVIKEMMALEQQRIEALSAQLGSQVELSATEDILPEQQEQRLREKDADDPSAAVFREPFAAKTERIRTASPYGGDPHWRLLSVIVKSGADLRQEQLALQLIHEMKRVWERQDVPVWVYDFRILITSDQSGLIETITDSISVHSIKKEGYAKHLNQQGIVYSLYDYFIKQFGQPGCDIFHKAQDNFMRSLAAYSIICYLLQIKDRHNGNILLDLEGHIAHIDFGFMLSNSPGSVGFELAPFKFPQEYMDILGGMHSEKFKEFRNLMKEAFIALRKQSDIIIGLVEIMEAKSTLPCFTGITTKPSAVAAPPPAATLAAAAALVNSPARPVSIESLPTSPLSPYPFGSDFTPRQSQLSNPTLILTSPNGAQHHTVTAPPPTTATLNQSSQQQYPVTAALKERFQLSMTDQQLSDHIDRLIESSCNNVFSRLYDSFQYYANGIL